jgi:hypothetical protein
MTLGVLACVVVLPGIGGCSSRELDSATKAPRPVPTPDLAAVKLRDLDDRAVDLRQITSGKVHVAIFIRSDCPISNRMAPDVIELYRTYEPQKVDFHLIYVDPREKPESIRAHLREYEYPCPALRDTQHTLVNQTKVTVTPEAVVFNGDWQIAYRGRINDQFDDLSKSRDAPSKRDLREAIDATLAGQPVAQPVTRAVGCYIEDLR